MLYLPRGKIAVKPLSDPDMVGSIIVPEIAKERSDQGVIIYMGPPRLDVTEDGKLIEIPYDFKIGDHVFFSGYDGTQVAIEGEGVLIFLEIYSIQCALHLGANPIVPGLYHLGSDGKYFPAALESALSCLGDALADDAILGLVGSGKRLPGGPTRSEAAFRGSRI